jgi:hypothetical protein
MRTKKIAIALLALGAWLLPATQAQAEPEPAWKLSLSSQPTNFFPGAEGTTALGPEYLLVAANVGGAPTSGTVTLTDTLPDGLVPLEARPFKINIPLGAPTCEVTGQQVSCTTDKPIDPGRKLMVQIPVKVELSEGSAPNEMQVEGGGAQSAAISTTTPIATIGLPFGFLSGAEGLTAPMSQEDGSPTTRAGSHPFSLVVDMAFPTKTPPDGLGLAGAGALRDVVVDLPRGQIVNPGATPKCTETQLTEIGGGINKCPEGSQIGTVSAVTNISGPVSETSGLYNMVPPPGAPSSFAFNAANVGIFVHILGVVRSDGDYGLSGKSNDILALGASPIMGVRTSFWGDPASHSFDLMRGSCRNSGGVGKDEEGNTFPAPCEVDGTGEALLTAPAECAGEQTTTRARGDSWEEPGLLKEASYASADLGGTPTEISACNQLSFEPSIDVKPTTNLADSPSGLDFTLHQPTDVKLGNLAPAIMKDTTVVLPQGMTVNPSSADGQGACSQADAKVNTMQAATCPADSKLASVEVSTPLLPNHVLQGALYLAKPFQNPFGSLLAIYLTVDDPSTGTVSNLAGKVSADPVTGQLSTRFEENPQLPLEDVKLHFFTGPRASFRTPVSCDADPNAPGAQPYATTADITPWSAPETANAHPSDSFAIQASPNGGICPTSAAGAPNAPSFSAGTISPQAGAYSPFVLKIKREDATQPLAGIDTTLPPGLIGKLAGVSYCPEASIAQAQGRSRPNEGALEIANPSCPASSEVGEVDVAAGAGITPLHVTGHAYLAGPYKGAPLSLVIVTPAVAGPFDLGTTVVRTALYLDPETAQIHAVSDPLPQILQGIPLDVRSVAVTMGRPDFTLNPTSCDPMQIKGNVTSALGQSAALSSPFQVGGCNALGFKPKLAIRLKGQTKRTGHPALTAVASFRAGDANTRLAQVTLPKSEFLDQAHIGTVCTRVQFAANQCPAAAVYGEAQATTPLLDKPLSGPVFLRSSSHELPDLVVALHGQVDVVLAGRIDSVNGGIRTTFEAAPDAPVSKFTLKMRGGKKGLLINSANLCKLKPAQTKATVKMEGQNGKVNDFQPVVKSSCGKAKRKKGRRGHSK